MRFRIEQRFAVAPAAVVAVLVDPGFLDLLDDLPRLGRPRLIDQHAEGDVVRRRVAHVFTGEMPPAARRFVEPSRLTWVEASTIHRRRQRAEWTVQADHYPRLLRASGTWSTEAAGEGGCSRVIEGEVRVSVPLVGGKVEAAIVDGFREYADAEQRAVAERLRGRPAPGAADEGG